MPIKHIISIKKTNSNYIIKLRYLHWRELAAHAFRIYNLTNVDKSWTPNGELRDSIIGFRNLAGINFMLRDTMAYDHFWSFICNGGGYKTPDGASEENAEARFKIQFNPDWNKTQEDPPKGTERKYSVEVSPELSEEINSKIDKNEVQQSANEPFQNQPLSFADNEDNQGNRETFNTGVYNAMKEMKNLLEEHEHNNHLDSLQVLTEALLTMRDSNNTKKIQSFKKDFTKDSTSVAELVTENNMGDLFVFAGENQQLISLSMSKKLSHPEKVNPDNISDFEGFYYSMYTKDSTILALKEENKIIEQKILEKEKTLDKLISKIDSETEVEYNSGNPGDYNQKTEIKPIVNIIENKIKAIKNE